MIKLSRKPNLNLNGEPLTWETFGDARLCLKVAVVLMPALLCGVLGYWCLIAPLHAEARQVALQQRAATQALHLKQQQLQGLQTIAQQLQTTRQQLAQAQAAWQHSVAPAQLIAAISHAALQTGVQVISLRPKVVVVRKTYHKQPIRVVVRGRYAQLYTFVQQLAQLQPPLALGDFSIAAEGSARRSGPLKMTVQVVNYLVAPANVVTPRLDRGAHEWQELSVRVDPAVKPRDDNALKPRDDNALKPK